MTMYDVPIEEETTCRPTTRSHRARAAVQRAHRRHATQGDARVSDALATFTVQMNG